MWLQCIGVVSWCCFKEVYIYPPNNYFLSLLHLYYMYLFCSCIPTSLFIFYAFFILVKLFVSAKLKKLLTNCM